MPSTPALGRQNQTRKVSRLSGESFYLYCLASVREKIVELRTLFGEGNVVYPVKTNPDSRILRVLHRLEVPFLVSSIEELRGLLMLFRKCPKVFYCSPVLDGPVLQYLHKVGVDVIIIDSVSQGTNLLEYCKEHDYHVDVFIRLTNLLEEQNSGYKVRNYLGTDVQQCINLARKIKESKSVNLVGIHAHLVSQNTNLALWNRFLEFMFFVHGELKEKGINLSAIDIGGGYPVDYGGGVLGLGEIHQLLLRMREKFGSNPRIIVEPGRYVVAEAGRIVSKVKTVKRTCGEDILVAGLSFYSAYLDALLVHLQLPCRNLSSRSKTTREYIVRGISPCSLDIMPERVHLPLTREGDTLVFLNSGAYPLSSDFMQIKRMKAVYVDNEYALRRLLAEIG